MTSKPLIYSCSGCSNVAQMTNYIALELTKRDAAEMSCIAGVGGGVPHLVKKAKAADKIIALDGCHLHCSKHCLHTQNIEPTRHITLSDLGHKKKYKKEFDKKEANALIDKLELELAGL